MPIDTLAFLTDFTRLHIQVCGIPTPLVYKSLKSVALEQNTRTKRSLRAVVS